MNLWKGQLAHGIRACLMLWLIGSLASCSSPSSRQILDERQSRNRARGAAYAADGFMTDHRSPDPRPYRPWEFYFKHCTFVSRNPYPSRAEHSCSDVH